MAKTTKKKVERVPAVSDDESLSGQLRKQQRRKEFASERSAQGKWENETFIDYSVEDLVSFLKGEDRFIHDDEGRSRRLLGNILNVGVSVMRDRSSAVDGIQQIRALFDWDGRSNLLAKKRYRRAKNAYYSLTGKKWKPK